MQDVRLADAPFDPAIEIGRFASTHPEAGGVASFVGLVRPTGGVEALELSHYAPLTLPGMESLASRAMSRFGLMGILIMHRVGVMMPGDPIVLVAAGSRHRRSAIQAVDFAMDHLKGDSWFWKREKRTDGWHWIEPREEDAQDLARWQQESADC